jgi:netrin-G3 ligand
MFVSAEKLPAGFPQITQAPSTKVVEIGHTAVLQCSAVGTPSPRISWVRDMLPVDTSKNSRYMILDSGTGMQGTLGIVTLTPSLQPSGRLLVFCIPYLV